METRTCTMQGSGGGQRTGLSRSLGSIGRGTNVNSAGQSAPFEDKKLAV